MKPSLIALFFSQAFGESYTFHVVTVILKCFQQSYCGSSQVK